MSKRSFDNNLVIAILGGGIGIMLYDVLQLSIKLWSNTLPFDDYQKEVNPRIYAGFAVMLFALFYALIAKFSKK